MLKQNDLIKPDDTTLERRRAFLKLSLAERRRILLQQTEDAAEHYEDTQSSSERETWQGGDIVDFWAFKNTLE